MFSRRWPLRDEDVAKWQPTVRRDCRTHHTTPMVFVRVISELTKNPARRATMAATEGRMAEEEFDDQEEGRQTPGVSRRPSDSPARSAGDPRR